MSLWVSKVVKQHFKLASHQAMSQAVDHIFAGQPAPLGGLTNSNAELDECGTRALHDSNGMSGMQHALAEHANYIVSAANLIQVGARLSNTLFL